VDNDHPYNIYGGLQDNGSWRGPSEVWENAGIRNLHWQEVGFGDGFDTLPDPENSRQGYVMSQGGILSRWNLDTGEQRLIRPAPHAPGVDLRFNWSAGLAQDPFDPATIYYGSQYLHKSTDRGATWTVVSPDLTSNRPEFQNYRESGGLTYDVTDAENYTTIVAVAPSPLEQGTIWVGTDDGRVHVTRNGGADWMRVDTRVKGAPAGAWVPMIAPSPHDAGTAFVVFDDHRRSDMKPYVFRTDDYGNKWKSLATDEISGYALSVLQDHEDPDLLFLGTEFGLFVSVDGGGSWTKFTAGLPTVSVMDMAIQARENDLVLGTHGRSIFVLDDYSALRGLKASDFNERLKLLSTTAGQQYDARQTPSTRFTGSGEFRAQNEPYGVMITFMASGNDLPHPDEELERERSIRLRSQAPAKDLAAENGDGEEEEEKPPKVKMTVKNASADLIRAISEPVHQGINRIVWGMEHDGVRPMPAPQEQEADKEKDKDLPGGPEVPAGEYVITLSLELQDAAAAEFSTRVTVLPDPRRSISAADRLRNHEAQLALQDLEEAAVTAVERIVHTRADVKTVAELIEIQGKTMAEDERGALADQAKAINDRLDELEKRFRTPPKTRGATFNDDRVSNMIGMAQNYVGSSYEPPTATADVYIELARTALNEGLAELNAFMGDELYVFKAAVEEAGIGLFSTKLPVTIGE
jgi:hypothetical protein